jgi:predicted transposase YdaD
MPLISPSLELAGEKGREEGREEGRKEGEQIGQQKLIIRLLNQRFGEIETTLVEQVYRLSVKQLEELTDVLLILPGVTDLEHWLQNK